MKNLNEYINNNTYNNTINYWELQKEIEKDINDKIDELSNIKIFNPLEGLYENETNEEHKQLEEKRNSREYKFIKIFLELCLEHYFPNSNFIYKESELLRQDAIGFYFLDTDDINSITLHKFTRFIHSFETNTNCKLDYKITAYDDKLRIFINVPEEYRLSLNTF